ncbi:Asparagine synthetase [Magnetospirillum sp. LM-5]|nr:Asparagine synthetase [Magnetospirillum sp. LM-5]
MFSPDQRFVLVYNGEVYNFRELKAALVAKGWEFRSQSDTEVVLYSLAQWGDDAIRRFNGFFALAFLDRHDGRLLLARDRYGIKPLYISQHANTLMFGSEIKAIRAHSSAPGGIDLAGLTEYMTFQNFFTDRTLFNGVRLVPAGTYISVDVRNGRVNADTRYWDYSFHEPSSPKPEAEYIEELDHLFCQAVKRQLISDVDVGSYLSGGMDSGSITAVAARHIPYMRTFTCGFDLTSASGIEMNFDERPAAEQMSYAFKTEHYEMVLKAGDMERVLPRLVHHLEEPRVGQCYPNFYAAQLASRFVGVVLSGGGGDELFGGYPWRYYRTVVNSDFDDYVSKYYAFWQRLIPSGSLPSVLAPIWSEVSHIDTHAIFRDVFKHHASSLRTPEDYVHHSLYFEAKTFLHGLLVVEDKLSMAHGVETRVPFLDNDLVDFAMALPAHLKLGRLSEVIRMNENDPGQKAARYFQKTNDGKLLLRKVMARYIPPEVAEREKQGFSAPDASWFKGESIDYIRRKILNRSARIYDLMDFKSIQSLVLDHLEGRENRRLLIWSLLYIENWLEQFSNAAPTEPR